MTAMQWYASRQQDAGARHALRVALVNNMPDGAFAATDRQFAGLIEQGLGGRPWELQRYTLRGVWRRPKTAAFIAERYQPVDALLQGTADAVVITGAEPKAATLDAEPYWGELVRLFGWARANAGSAYLSCLAAHAYVLAADGISRVPLPAKCTGVFAQDWVASDPLTANLAETATVHPVIPHSRLNEVPADALTGAGYRVLLGSSTVGWTVATKMVDRCRLVLVQGHPEYDPTSLLREYQRDASRYLSGEQDALPALPCGAVGRADRPALSRFHDSLRAGQGNPDRIASFPFDEAGRRAGWPWRVSAVQLFGNWLAKIAPPVPQQAA